jgi:AcrR family transcriptional regulator
VEETHSTDTGRDRITDAAAELFLRNGYAQTSLRDIAAAVGIKAGSIYYHFDSKEALLLDVLQRGIDVMVAAFERAEAETVGADAATRVGAHIRAHLSALFEHGPYTANHVSAFRTAPAAVRQKVIADRDRYEAMWTQLFEDLEQVGSVSSELDLRFARLSLFGAMNFSIEWFDAGRGNLDDLAEAIWHQIWRGMAA